MSHPFTRLFLLICLFPGIATSQTELTEQQQGILDEALREMLISISSDPAFSDMDWSRTDALILRQPETHRQLGAILNANHDADVDARGLEVLAVTPGLLADRLGLRPGDRIIRINRLDLLNRGADEATRSRAYRQFLQTFSELAPGAALELQVRRQGQTQTLRGRISEQRLPRVRLEILSDSQPQSSATAEDESSRSQPPAPGCGSVNARQPTPHADDIFPVVITGINSPANDLRQRDVVYLTPGTYRVRLLDFIPHYELRSKHTRFARSRPSRELTVTVEDGQVYYLGAKLLYTISEQADHDDYWQPVVWKSEALTCLGTPISP